MSSASVPSLEPALDTTCDDYDDDDDNLYAAECLRRAAAIGADARALADAGNFLAAGDELESAAELARLVRVAAGLALGGASSRDGGDDALARSMRGLANVLLILFLYVVLFCVCVSCALQPL